MSKILTPPEGDTIQIGQGGAPIVPDRPIIPQIIGDGIGRDISKAMVRVIDAAVAHAYSGQKKIAWFPVPAGEEAFSQLSQWLPEETLAAISEYKVAIKGPLTTHLGAYPSAMMLANTCDSMLALGILGGLLAWERWLSIGGRAWLLACAVCFAYAVVSKESSIIFPVHLLLMALVLGRGTRRPWIALAGFGLAAALYAGVIYTRQSNTAGSYLATGALSFSPPNYCRQLADFSISTLVPFLHVVAWPLGRLSLPHALFWILRLLTLGGLALAAARFLRRPQGRMNHYLVLSAAAGLLMPSLYAGKPDARFLYLALPFVCILLANLLINARRTARVALACGVMILWGLFALSFYTSDTFTVYRATTRNVERFTQETIRLAPSWQPGSVVTVFNHPHPGPPEWRWVYCQLIINIFVPQARATLSLDAITPETAHAYRFNGRELTPMPLPTASH